MVDVTTYHSLVLAIRPGTIRAYRLIEGSAEVVVDGDQMHLARARETFDDMIRGELLLPE